MTNKILENYEIITGDYYKAKYFINYVDPEGNTTAHTITGENYNPDYTLMDVIKEVRKYAKKTFKDYTFKITKKDNRMTIKSTSETTETIKEMLTTLKEYANSFNHTYVEHLDDSHEKDFYIRVEK